VLVVITYDVSTSTAAGRRRLSRVARACVDHGQRVQNSVFECRLPPARFAELRRRLLDEICPEEDSLRFYFLGREDRARRRIEHHGTKSIPDLEGPLIV